MEQNKTFCNELRDFLNKNFVILNESPEQPVPGVQELSPSPEEMAPPEGEEQPMEEQDIQDPEMQDADYMMDPNQGGDMTPQEPQDPTDPRRLTHLFDNFDDLLKMTKDFYDNLERIDVNLLNPTKVKYLKLVLENIDALTEKIKEHILYNFKAKEYEENLYIYMLLRAELLTNISLLRKTLNIRKK